MDELSKKIVQIIEISEEPLETKEIENRTEKASRVMIINRLKDLRGDGKIRGKRVGAGTKGVWIWWK